MTNNDIPNQTSTLYNVQPTSHTSEKRIFPSLPYTSENLKFINKFNFQFSDLTDSEYITLCNMLLNYKTCYATHKNDVGKNSTPFRIRLKPNAQLMTQRPSKVPLDGIETSYVSYHYQTVSYDGVVGAWSSQVTIKFSCSFDISHFPFDQHTCNLKFGQWVFDTDAYTVGKFLKYWYLFFFFSNIFYKNGRIFQ